MWVMGLETLTAGTESRDDEGQDSGRASKLQKPPGQDSRIPGFQCNSHFHLRSYVDLSMTVQRNAR